MLIKVNIAAKIKIDISLKIYLFSARTKPNREDKGTAKNAIVNILPPSAIPNIFTAIAGNVEKCPPSHKKAKPIKML